MSIEQSSVNRIKRGLSKRSPFFRIPHPHSTFGVPMSLPKLANYAGGKFVEPISAAYLDNVDPSTGAVYSYVPDSDDRDAERAVAAAEKAFVTWSQTPTAERSRILLKLADLIDANLERLARAECIDNGKPVKPRGRWTFPAPRRTFAFSPRRSCTFIRNRTDRRRRVELHASPAARRLRDDLALELAAVPVQLEGRSGDRLREHGGGETLRTHADDGLHALRVVHAGGIAARCAKRGSRPGAKAGSAIVAHPNVRTLSFTGGTVTGREIAHRWSALQEGGPGTRRQEPQPYLCRRGLG